MKTQIFRLLAEDDLLSVRDQMGWIKSPRVLIVLPAVKKPNFSPLDFVLLAREAERMGAQAAFVLSNLALRSQLETLGLHCFGTVQQAERSPWRARSGMRPQPVWAGRFSLRRLALQRAAARRGIADVRIPDNLRIAIVLLVCAAILSLAAGCLPRASLTIDPDRHAQSYTLLLRGDSSLATTPVSGVIHASPLEFTLTGQIDVQATGQLTVGDGYAAGEVYFYNLTDHPITLPAGVVLQADTAHGMAQFETLAEALIPSGGKEPATVAVRAVNPGTQYNLPEMTDLTVSGPLGLSIRAGNPGPLTGGTDLTVPAVSARDVQLARRVLLERLDAQARSAAFEHIADARMLIPASLNRVSVLSQDLSPTLNLPSQRATLTLQAGYTAWTVDETDLKHLAAAVLDTLLTDGYSASAGEVKTELSGPFEAAEGGFLQSAHFTRTIQRAIEPQQVISLLKGRRTRLAGMLVQERFHLSQTPSVRVWPNWWPILPFFGFQYEIIGP